VAQRGTVERVLMGCGGLAILGVLAVVLLTLGAILGRSDVDVEPLEDPVEAILDEQEQNEPVQVQPVGPEPENAAAIVLRVSGQQGVPYSGTYGTAQGVMLPVEGVLGPVPAEYGVETGGAFGTISAAFRKTQPVPGMLKVELLSAGEVVAEGESSDEWGSVEVGWNPQA
jgi:hypothetical protein